jgi:hypothetical protein
MSNIPYPFVDGATQSERITQINDYIGRYSVSLNNMFNNIGIDNLNPALAKRINSSIRNHQPLNEYAPLVRVDKLGEPVEEGLDGVEEMLEEKHREGFVMKPYELEHYEPQEKLATLYTIDEMNGIFFTLGKMLKEYDRKYDFSKTYINKTNLKVLTVLDQWADRDVEGLNSRLDKVAKILK